MSVLITGNTYPVRAQLKTLGARWDAAAKGWLVPDEKAEQARRLVDAPTAPKRSPAPSRFRPNGMSGICAACGDDCGGGLWSCGYGEYPREAL